MTGIAVESGKPLRAADRASLKQTLNRSCSEFVRKHRGASQSLVRFAESGTAGSPGPTLNPALTEVPKLLAVVVLASTAGHG
jgi:hypothetical protein